MFYRPFMGTYGSCRATRLWITSLFSLPFFSLAYGSSPNCQVDHYGNNTVVYQCRMTDFIPLGEKTKKILLQCPPPQNNNLIQNKDIQVTSLDSSKSVLTYNRIFLTKKINVLAEDNRSNKTFSVTYKCNFKASGRLIS